MIPYGKHEITADDVESVVEALQSERITQGEYVEKFEEELCNYFGCDYAVAVNTGTMALYLTYKAMDVSDTRALTTPNTFVATVNGMTLNGAEPGFIDIKEESFNLDTETVKRAVEGDVSTNFSALVPVHFGGLPCDMSQLYEIADRNDLFVLEDACHAPGAEWHDGDEWITVGSCRYSDAATLSFHPVKHFTTGEGGAVLTNDQEFADQIRTLRTHGIKYRDHEIQRNDGPWSYEQQELGMNGRITDFQCALGCEQLSRLDAYLEKRRAIAKRYREAFLPMNEVRCQADPDSKRHAYHLFAVRAENRDALYDYLNENGISPQVHYIPVHYQPYYQKNFNFSDGDFPNSEAYYEQALSLPMYPTLTEKQQDNVINHVKEFYA